MYELGRRKQRGREVGSHFERLPTLPTPLSIEQIRDPCPLLFFVAEDLPAAVGGFKPLAGVREIPGRLQDFLSWNVKGGMHAKAGEDVEQRLAVGRDAHP